jgi:hypothetical protein
MNASNGLFLSPEKRLEMEVVFMMYVALPKSKRAKALDALHKYSPAEIGAYASTAYAPLALWILVMQQTKRGATCGELYDQYRGLGFRTNAKTFREWFSACACPA